MGNKLFLLFLSLSLSGTVLAALVFGVKAVFRKKFSAKWKYYIWLLVIARLLIPVALETNLVGTVFERGNFSDSGDQANEGAAIAEPLNEEQNNSASDTDNLSAGTGKVSDGEVQPAAEVLAEGSDSSTEMLYGNAKREGMNWSHYLWMIWIFGIVLSFSLRIVDYRNFLRYLKLQNREVKDERILALMDDLMSEQRLKRNIKIYFNKLAVSPMLIGGIHPCIVLPAESIGIENLSYVLMHELTHFKRKDIWVKWLFQFTLCVHWFNPFLLLVNRDLNRSCELSCDERVLDFLSHEERNLYGNVLLDIADIGIRYKSGVLSVTLIENKKNLKERLAGIMSYKKFTKWTVLCSALVLCLLLTAGLAVGAMSVDGGSQLKQDKMKYLKAEGTKLGLIDKLDANKGELSIADSQYLSSYGGKENKEKADKIYNSDRLIAGRDFSSECYSNNYMRDDNSLSIKNYHLIGSETLWIADVKQDVSIQLSYAVERVSGKLKLCLIGPDNKVTVLQEGKGEYKGNILLTKGRNRLKLVGTQKKANSSSAEKLNLSYQKPTASLLIGWYDSEGEETAEVFVRETEKSGKVDLTKFKQTLVYMEEEDTDRILMMALREHKDMSGTRLSEFMAFTGDSFSELLIQYLKAGNLVTKEQMSVMLPFLDETAVNEYARVLIQKGGSLSEKELVNIAPFMDGVYIAELLNNSMEKDIGISDSTLSKLLPFVDEDVFGDYLIERMEKGKMPTISQMMAFAPLLGSDCIDVYLRMAGKGKIKLTEEQLGGLTPFIDDESVLGDYIMSRAAEAPKDAMQLLIRSAYSMGEDDIAEILKRIIQSGVKISIVDASSVFYYMDGSDVADILDMMVDRKLITRKEARNYSWYTE